jgi:CheY-like chemotaxis protein
VLQQEDVSYASFTSVNMLLGVLDTLVGIDIVFLDLELPRRNGFEVLKVMRAYPNFKDTRFIAYSVHVSELREALEQGFDGFLGKPLSAELFPDQLRRILRGEIFHYLP